MAIKMVTEEMVVLEKSAKDAVCKNGETKTFYNVKCGSSSYENQIFGVEEDVYNTLNEGDQVCFSGNFGGLQNKFWRVTGIAKYTPKKTK